MKIFISSLITALIIFWFFQYYQWKNNEQLNHQVFASIEDWRQQRLNELNERIRLQNEKAQENIKKYKEEEIAFNSAPQEKKKIVKEEFATLKQWLNTCFFESISVIHLNDTWKKLDLNKIYKKMWMKYWDFFLPWRFDYDKLSGWRFSSTKESYWLDKLIDVYWFGFNQLVSTVLIEEQLDKWEQWIMIAPMNVFKENDKTDIWHAVAVYQIDNEYIYFSNTLTAKLEKIKIDDISIDWIMFYPVLFTDNKNFEKLNS